MRGSGIFLSWKLILVSIIHIYTELLYCNNDNRGNIETVSMISFVGEGFDD